MTVHITKFKLALAVLAIAVAVPATALAVDVFTDVADDAFFAEPVKWAADNSITTGTGDGTEFSPLNNVTRGESVTFLKRYDDNIVQPALSGLEAAVAANTSGVASNADNASKLHWAVVEEDGTLNRASSAAITSSRDSVGIYHVAVGRDMSQCSFIAGLSNPADGTPTEGMVISAVLFEDNQSLYVEAQDFTGPQIDNNFHVQIMC